MVAIHSLPANIGALGVMYNRWYSTLQGGVQWNSTAKGSTSLTQDAKDAVEQYVNVPMGVSDFPKDIMSVPKGDPRRRSRLIIDWARSTGNLMFHRRHTAGGHFASWEKPEELVDDL